MDVPETRYTETVDGVAIAYQVLGNESPAIVFANSAWASDVEICLGMVGAGLGLRAGLASRGTLIMLRPRAAPDCLTESAVIGFRRSRRGWTTSAPSWMPSRSRAVVLLGVRGWRGALLPVCRHLSRANPGGDHRRRVIPGLWSPGDTVAWASGAWDAGIDAPGGWGTWVPFRRTRGDVSVSRPRPGVPAGVSTGDAQSMGRADAIAALGCGEIPTSATCCR